jgi:hypothetical protein
MYRPQQRNDKGERRRRPAEPPSERRGQECAPEDAEQRERGARVNCDIHRVVHPRVVAAGESVAEGEREGRNRPAGYR